MWMAVNVWVSGLLHSPQSHIIKSVTWGLAFVGFFSLRCSKQAIGCDDGIREEGLKALNRRFLLGFWTVNSPQSHIVRVYDAGHGKSGVFHSAEWHDGDWSSDGIREAWLWFFIWVESF
ncbi:hypothetical protein TNCV_1256611 [Trichonephila clavipes]|nr:hypothetical protein TNCV_1256611 [Trichonephila clavipes]